jgi:hypothetical protein
LRDLDTQDALYAVLGAGLGGAGGYGLYKLLTPTKYQTTGLGLGSAALGALAGGGLGIIGSNKYDEIRAAMLAEGLKVKEEIAKKVQDKINALP